MKNYVITIGKTYGSGGSVIAGLLKERLGVPCYAKELLTLASVESGISEELFGETDEKLKGIKSNRSDTPVYTGEIIRPGYPGFLSQENRFFYQAKIMLHKAQKESCIIMGRGSNFVLRTFPNVLSVQVDAPFEVRVMRIMKEKELSYKEAVSLIQKRDADMKNFYRYYTGASWDNVDYFDIRINSAKVSPQQAAELILRSASVVLGRELEE